MTEKEKEKYVTSLWKNPAHAAAFAGPDKVYDVIKNEGKYKIGRGQVKKILRGIEAYSVQKPARRNFKRNRVIVSGIDEQFDGDLASMENVSSFNSGVKFLIVLIDVYSRFLIIRSLKDKKSASVMKALKNIFTQTNTKKPRTIRFDQGGEFKGEVKRYLKKENIHVFYTNNSQIKSNYAERVIKTIKQKIYTYFMEKQTYRYLDVLQDIVKSYNNTPHQSLNGATPASVNKSNEDEIRYMQYLSRQKTKRKSDDEKTEQTKKRKKGDGKTYQVGKKKRKSMFKYHIGDIVRISHLKNVFQKGYSENWTLEYFKIYKRFVRDNKDLYVLKDMTGEILGGTFYRYEVQKITADDTNTFKIEKIIKKRRNKENKQEEVLIRWLGWPSKFDSWVPLRDVKNI
ncbi:unnamed protein product [Mytilus coruscus]|uniref:Integrase catalytic domain-containing protein n=1 Tax=Mytilus coruscus TaxID=42192 RepID=A0A6J7ZZK8_MYTCO|nr:unnamed protein product [Mytilus coruscus]